MAKEDNSSAAAAAPFDQEATRERAARIAEMLINDYHGSRDKTELRALVGKSIRDLSLSEVEADRVVLRQMIHDAATMIEGAVTGVRGITRADGMAFVLLARSVLARPH